MSSLKMKRSVTLFIKAKGTENSNPSQLGNLQNITDSKFKENSPSLETNENQIKTRMINIITKFYIFLFFKILLIPSHTRNT